MYRLYRGENPNGCSRSMFYRFFAHEKYERMSLMGGLCSSCDLSGYFVIKTIESITERHIQEESTRRSLKKRTHTWLRHARMDLARAVSQHLSCRSHCYDH